MTKQDFKTRVGMGFFSCEWINNSGSTSKVKRGILGGYAWRHTNNPVPTNVKEHSDYVLAYRVGNGLLPQHRRWANINPNTVIKLNGVTV
jgi:hypothetical protein|tara:strand:+ start:177 stop:446 length:270 start_codon:yes stop_codon:yes gene_type:complete